MRSDEKNFSIEKELLSLLQRAHAHPEKQKIDKNEKRLNFACPICGDSHDNYSKKRGHLYIKNFFYVCYNCGVKMPATKLFEKMGKQLDPGTVLYMSDQARKNSSSIEKATIFEFDLEHYLMADEVAEVFNEKHPKIFGMQPLHASSEQMSYIKKIRKLKNHKYVWQCYYKRGSKFIPCVSSMNMNRKGILLGFQIRSITEPRIYLVWNFEDVWKFLGKQDLENGFFIYNKLSYLYGILNCDFNRPITIFEGYFDSTFFPNSIGLTGMNTETDFLENADLDLRFFYDNDKDGHRMALKKFMDGFSVFLWKKFFKDVSKKSNDPAAMEHKLKTRIKDLNDLGKRTKDPYYKFKLEDYFSRDSFDAINI